jgi:hypothetical protein
MTPAVTAIALIRLARVEMSMTAQRFDYQQSARFEIQMKAGATRGAERAIK